VTCIRIFLCVAAAAIVIASPGAGDAQTRGSAAMARTQAAAPERRALSFSAQTPAPAGSLVLPLAGEGDLAVRASDLDAATRDSILRAIGSARFDYGARETLSLRGVGAWDRILVLGLGESPDSTGYQRAGAVAGRALISERGPVAVAANGLSADAVAEFATGMGIGEYRSDLYRTSGRDEDARGPATIVSDSAAAAEALYAGRGRALVEAMTWTRDISNEPANVIYPESFVTRARAAFAGIRGVQIQVLDVPAMERLGMGAILGVGRGSERPPRLLVVHYRGAGAPEGGPIVLAGKGITFDSGGLSLKTGDGMLNMKMDMSGAASVTGAVLALARSDAPVNVVAIAALAENMPDGGAIRPGDVLTAMNGKTIEVISTDAEGRLVLADALAWAERNLSPAAVIDVATLTGAVRGALGDEYAGLFSRHDDLAAQLEAAGRVTGETLWRLPLHDSYREDVRSNIADIKNSSGSNAGAGAGTGAYFIGEFISRDIPWAHIDIANVAWSNANDWKPEGSAAFGVRLLERFVRDFRPASTAE
jgi:leucyl aminopeptidase